MRPMMLQLIVNLNGAIRKDAAANVYVSYCPTLKIYSQGETEDQASEALKSAVTLFLTHCVQNGQIDFALKKLGMVEAGASAITSVDSRVDEWIAIREAKFEEAFPFSVPLNLVVSQQKQAAGA
jgi:predicted RNase H-like HicB family nuclease